MGGGACGGSQTLSGIVSDILRSSCVMCAGLLSGEELAADMDVDEAFEQLYRQLVQNKEEDSGLESISGHNWKSSTGSENSASSPQMTFGMLTRFSKHVNTGFKSCKWNQSMLSTEKRKNISLVYISKCRVDKNTSTVSHQQNNIPTTTQNGADTLHDEPDFEDSYSTRCSDTEYSYERADGYESGVSKRSDKRYLCRECRKLYKKARKKKGAAEVTPKEKPKKPEYSHWSRKYWMMMNRVPSQTRNKKKKDQYRTLNSVLRKIKTKKQTGNFCLGCCRTHSFLKRNLRLCTTTKRKFGSLNGRQKRKRPASAEKCFQKSKAKRKKSLPCSIEKKVPKKAFVFVLDSSEEEDTRPNVKRYKILNEDPERNCSQQPKEDCRPMADANTLQDQNTSEHTDIDSPATQNEEALGTFNQRFNIHPQGNDGSLDIAGPSVFDHVQSGSFKELLQKIKLGYPRSGIVRENRI